MSEANSQVRGSEGFFQRRYGLSDDGAKCFVRATAWSALAYLANMVPVIILVMAAVDMLRPIEVGSEYVIEPWKYFLAFVVSIIALIVTQKRKYRATFCDTYEESSRRRIAIAERLRLLPLSFFGMRDLADLTTVIMSDAEGSEHAMSHALPQLWGAVAFAAVSALLLALCDWRMALACLWVVPVSLGVVFASRGVQRRWGLKMNEGKLESSEAIQEIIDCAPDILACNRQELVSERLAASFERVEQLQGSYELVASVALTSARAFLQLGVATTLLAGVALLANGELSMAMFLLFVLVATRIYDPLTELFMNILEVFAVEVSNDRLARIERHPLAGGTLEFSPEGYDLHFEDVRFSYEGGQSILNGVSFTARQGQVTALVGPSGSGKTTVSRLAARLWDVQGGVITLGGVDVSTVDPEVLLGSFSVVFQDVMLFSGSVRDNIRLGRQGASDEEVEAAASAAQCDGFLARLPRGLDTEVAEGGATLSGGERQRISIARALLKDAPVVLLDEATASLDPESESHVQQAIAELTDGKTVLMVAHRMRTVLDADHVVVIDGGRVAEEGSPAELVSSDGLFARLCRMQGVGR